MRRVALAAGMLGALASAVAWTPASATDNGSVGAKVLAGEPSASQRVEARVDRRRDPRLRVLVVGDSMVFGLPETLAGDLGSRGSVRGDAHSGAGISSPHRVDWPAQARKLARTDQPDVTVVLLGGSEAGFPLTASTGEVVPCCDVAWRSAYAGRVHAMMAAYRRAGRGLVYWLLVPAPLSPQRAILVDVANVAARQAASSFDDGVRVIDRAAAVLAPHDHFQTAIRFHGRQRAVRDPDGLHLTNLGIRITVNVVKDALRADGLLR